MKMEKKYIDVDQLFRCDTCHHHRSGKCDTWCENGESYRPDVSIIKTADVAPVVWCKDCKHYTDFDVHHYKWLCSHFCNKFKNITREYDFCSFGERKERSDMEKMSFEEMISALDEAAGRLIVPSTRDGVIRKAHELIMAVSISLGEWAEEMAEGNAEL